MRRGTIRGFRSDVRRLQGAAGLLLQERTPCCCGVTMAQCHVLLAIEAARPTTLVDLSRSLRLDKSTLSRTIDGLVALRLVTRDPDSSDRRYNVIELSERGVATCAELNRIGDRTSRKIFARIPRDRHDTVVEGIRLLVDALDAAVCDEECCAPEGPDES